MTICPTKPAPSMGVGFTSHITAVTVCQKKLQPTSTKHIENKELIFFLIDKSNVITYLKRKNFFYKIFFTIFVIKIKSDDKSYEQDRRGTDSRTLRRKRAIIYLVGE